MRTIDEQRNKTNWVSRDQAKQPYHITLFSRRGCTCCEQLEKYFTYIGLNHDYRSVDTDKEAEQLMWTATNGSMTYVPVTLIQDADNKFVAHITGFPTPKGIDIFLQYTMPRYETARK